MKHVRINNVWYRLAEDAEGKHYNLALQPLRPPNSQLVQGNTSKFQIRPDVLLWSWTNWSGGENQIKFDTQDPARSYILQGVEPFQKVGTLGNGYLAEQVTSASDIPWSTQSTLLLAQNNLWAITNLGTTIYPWDSVNDRWGATEFMTGVAGTDPNSAVGDSDYIFVHDTNTDQIYRRDIAGTWTLHNDQCTLTGEVVMAEHGAYVYIWVPERGEVYEISKETANTTTAETPLAYLPVNDNVDADRMLMVAGDARVYVVSFDKQKTIIHELTPSSAAGTGFGTELSTIYGVQPECVFYAGGTLFLVGHDRTPDDTTASDRQVFYIDPQGSYGTLGSVRGFTKTNGPSALQAVPAGGRLAMSAFALPATWEDDDSDDVRLNLFELDQITGGFAAVGGDDALLSATEQPLSLVYFEGAYYVSTPSTVIRWNTDSVSGETGIAVSPANDFGISGEKILDTIEVVFDPLPASASVTVGYQLDDGTWTDVLVSDTDGATGGTIEVSTDSSTAQFRSLKMRVKLVGDARVLSVDAYARVNRRIKVWDLLLDASDDAAPQGWDGAKIIDNITGLADNTVVEFVDNYQSHRVETPVSRDVIVDTATVDLSQPGEGTISVRLIEVL